MVGGTAKPVTFLASARWASPDAWLPAARSGHAGGVFSVSVDPSLPEPERSTPAKPDPDKRAQNPRCGILIRKRRKKP